MPPIIRLRKYDKIDEKDDRVTGINKLNTSLGDESIAEYLNVMLDQEDVHYTCSDYLATVPTDKRRRKAQHFVNEECREKMLGWCFHLVDTFDYDREILSFTASYVDRYLQTPSGWKALESRTRFKLVIITALYMAVKIHDLEVLSPRSMVTISQNQFTEDNVTAMEMKMSMALNWRLHPPTPLAFIELYLSKFSLMFNHNNRHKKIFEKELVKCIQLIRYQIELAVCYYPYTYEKPSTLAFAVMANAFQLLRFKEFSDSQSSIFLKTIRNMIGIQNDKKILVLQKALVATLMQNMDTQNAMSLHIIPPSYETSKSLLKDKVRCCSESNSDKDYDMYLNFGGTSPKSVSSHSQKTSLSRHHHELFEI
jgi:hypothetical protein